jgi:hypothetical protein
VAFQDRQAYFAMIGQDWHVNPNRIFFKNNNTLKAKMFILKVILYFNVFNALHSGDQFIHNLFNFSSNVNYQQALHISLKADVLYVHSDYIARYEVKQHTETFAEIFVQHR